MDLNTVLKKDTRPPLFLIRAASSLGSRSRMNPMLSATVLPNAKLAITQRILNCVLPKNHMYFGRLTYPATYPIMLPTPTTRLAIAFAASGILLLAFGQRQDFVAHTLLMGWSTVQYKCSDTCLNYGGLAHNHSNGLGDRTGVDSEI